MNDVKAMVRTDCVSDLIKALERAEVTRFHGLAPELEDPARVGRQLCRVDS
jgi:hypothetical protein